MPMFSAFSYIQKEAVRFPFDYSGLFVCLNAAIMPQVDFVFGSTFCIIMLLISPALQLIMVRVGNFLNLSKESIT